MRPRLGELMLPMMVGMTERGPDSAGLAVFTEPVRGPLHKLNLCAGAAINWEQVQAHLCAAIAGEHTFRVTANHAVMTTSASPDDVQAWIDSNVPALTVLCVGRAIDLYKDTGLPADVAKRYGFAQLRGTHLIGHTRMATESAVTPAHAHPFTAGHDFCLVHNGSLSNPNMVRRKLEPLGIRFRTDNDTEAACRYFEWRLREGDSLRVAVERGFEELDGFYTFLMGTDQELALVCDSFGCKPAIIAETDDYVAVASEFRSLAHLPHVHEAHLFEPRPMEVYSWRI